MLLYLQVTRGAEFGRNHLFPPAAPPTVFAFASPYPVPDARDARARASRAVTLQDIRWDRCDIKSIALLANVLLRQEAADRGADEALLVRDGLLLEGSSSTVFLCIGGTLVTPPNDHRILPGTSRDAVLELAQGWLPTEVCPLEAREIASCDEVWIASAGRGVLPVTARGRRAGRRRADRGRCGARCTPACSDTSTTSPRRPRSEPWPKTPCSSSRATSPSRSWARRPTSSAASRSASSRVTSARSTAARIEERPSSGGKYLGLTITVRAESKAQLDAVYTGAHVLPPGAGRALRPAGKPSAASSRGASASATTPRSGGPAEIAHLRHLEPRVTAGVDAPERLEVHRDVEREPVVRAALADAQADARELAGTDVHAGRVAPAEGLDAPLRHRRDDGALDALDQRAHAEPGAIEVEQRIHHELARAVVGHLPAAIDLHDRDVAGAEQVLGLASSCRA